MNTDQQRPDPFWKWFAVAAVILIGGPIAVGLWILILTTAAPSLVRQIEKIRTDQIKAIQLARSPSSFESVRGGDYSAPAILEGWTVTANEVAVVTDPRGAFSGSNFLALADGTVTKTFPTKPGLSYELRFYARGPGLLDWWPGDNNANDIVGTNNGTIPYHDVTYNIGKVNNGFVFSGVSIPDGTDTGNEVDFGANAGNFGTNDFTIDFWIKVPAGQTGLYAIMEKRPVCNANSSFLDIHLGHEATLPMSVNGALALDSAGNGDTDYSLVLGVKKINDGLFHHAAFVQTGAINSIYVDGFLDNSFTNSAPADINNLNQFRAGQTACTGVDGSQPFNGELDEIRVINRALSPAEISAIYRTGGVGRPDSASPLPNFAIAIDSVVANTIILTNAAGAWQPFTNSFIASNAQTKIELSGNALGVLLDDIQLGPAPPRIRP